MGVVVTDQSLCSLITYLAGQPSMDKLAQFLALDAFADFEPRGALISAFDGNGQVHAVGAFGLEPDVVRGLQHLSVWDHSPAVDAIRFGQPLILTDGEAVKEKYPWLAEHQALLQPTVAWPLGLGVERLGAVQMQFLPAPNLDGLTDRFRECMPLVALYMGLSHATPSHNGSPDGKHDAKHDGMPEGPLTDRQLSILQMLAKGMTNPQIAARIGFSDSTVRQETMHIYRYLGASGRREASRIAAMRGLLMPEHSTV